MTTRKKKKTTRRKTAKKTSKKKTPAKKKAKGKQGPKKRKEVPAGLSPEAMAEMFQRDDTEQKHFSGPIAATRMTPKKRLTFLETLAETGNVTEACKVACMSRDCAYRLKRKDDEFAEMWETAIEIASDALEAEARRRAKDGWLEPVHWQGIPMSVVRKYSDTLLIFLLKGARPDKYRERYDVNSKQRIETEPTFVFYPSNGREVVDDDKETENAK
jgi:hypothetical protein